MCVGKRRIKGNTHANTMTKDRAMQTMQESKTRQDEQDERTGEPDRTLGLVV